MRTILSLDGGIQMQSYLLGSDLAFVRAPNVDQSDFFSVTSSLAHSAKFTVNTPQPQAVDRILLPSDRHFSSSAGTGSLSQGRRVLVGPAAEAVISGNPGNDVWGEKAITWQKQSQAVDTADRQCNRYPVTAETTATATAATDQTVNLPSLPSNSHSTVAETRKTDNFSATVTADAGKTPTVTTSALDGTVTMDKLNLDSGEKSGSTYRYFVTDNYGNSNLTTYSSTYNTYYADTDKAYWYGWADTDASLCWAATASNILQAQGWGASFTSEDTIFDHFMNCWPDDGGTPVAGFSWWINGGQWPGIGNTVVGSGGNFFPLISKSTLSNVGTNYYPYYNPDGQAMWNKITDLLESGYMVGLGIFGGGAHAITCWGYEVAGDGSTYLYISDSDDEYGTINSNSGNRTSIPNNLRREKVEIGADTYLHFTDTYGSEWYVGDLDCLKRYDKVYEGKSETAADAANITVNANQGAMRGEIGLAGDADYYSFTASVSGFADIVVDTVFAGVSFSATVSVYNALGTLITTSAAAALHNLDFLVTAGSQYYLLVKDVATLIGDMEASCYSVKVNLTQASNIDNLVIGSGGSVMSANLAAGLTGSGNQVVSGGTFDINGNVTATIVSQSTAVINILSGGSANNTTVSSGGKINVSNGGYAQNTLISSGAIQTVFSGGLAQSGTVKSGGIINLYQGGTALNTVVNSGGKINAAWSLTGTAKLGGTTFMAGLLITVNPGNNYTVDGQGGTINFMVSQRTAADSFMIDNMANVSNVNYSITVGAAQTFGSYLLAGSAAAFAADVSLTVGSNVAGTLSLSRLLSYGNVLYALSLNASNELQLTLSTAPVTDNLVIGYGGSVMTYTLSGGLTGNNNQVVSGGTYNVFGTANNTIVSQTSAVMNVNSGASAVSTTIGSGGQQIVNNGASATNIDIFDGGRQIVNSGASVNSTTLYSDARQVVNSGASAFNTIILASARQIVSSGASAVSATVSPGGTQQVYGQASETVIGWSGLMDVLAGGVAVNATVNNGGRLNLHSDTVASNAKIYSGGILDAAREIGSAYLNGTTTLGGNIVTVSSGSNYALNAQGGTVNLMVSQRTTADDIMIDNLANISNVTYTVTVSATQTLGEYRLAGGASIFASNIGVTVGATAAGSLSLTKLMIYNNILYTLSLNALNQLTLTLDVAPQIDNLVIGSGGSVMSSNLSSGLNGSGNQVVSGGSYNVWGTANSTTVSQASAVMTVASGGMAKVTNISSGGRQIISAGGSAADTTVNAGGNQQIYGGATNTVINFGGVTDVFSGGIVTSATVNSGGILDLHSQAKAGHLLVNSGGILDAAGEPGGALLYGTTALGGNIITVSSGSNYTLNAQGGTIKFMLTQRVAADPAMIDNLANITNANYTITVSATQADGNYLLADGAAGFNQTVSIGTAVSSFGTLTVNGGAVRYNSIDYRLHNDSGSLWLEVKLTDLTAPTLSGSPSATVDGYNATVWWNAASDNVGVAGYYLKVNGQTYTVTDNSYVLQSLVSGSYSYQLQAFDAAGNKSSWSSTQTFTIRDVSTPVLNGTPAATVSYNSATISWNAAFDNVGVTKYLVKVNNQTYTVNRGTALTLNNLGGGLYQYQLAAVDGAGNQSDWSANQNFVVSDYRKEFQANITNATTIFLEAVKLDAGTYYFGGTYAPGLNATITVVDKANGKVVTAVNVKNGVIQSAKPLLLNGNYQLSIYSTDKGKTLGKANIVLGGSLFYQANQAQDEAWKTAPSITYGSKVEEWVGFSDNIDYRKLEISTSGTYSFNLSGLKNGAKLTVYTINAKGALQALKSISATPKYDKFGILTGGSSATLSSLLLTAGQQYYIGVEAPGAAKGLNTGYTLEVGGTLFNNVNNQVANNNWRDTQVATLDLKQGIVNEWVGFGDAADFFQFSLAANQAGAYGFKLNSKLDKAAVMTIYKFGYDKKGSPVLTAVKAGKDGLLVLSAGKYYMGVVSADNGKGIKNTDYSISVTLPDLAVWKSNGSMEIGITA